MFIGARSECNLAATALGLSDNTAQAGSWGTLPYGCYFEKIAGKLYFNRGGNKDDDSTDRLFICKDGGGYASHVP